MIAGCLLPAITNIIYLSRVFPEFQNDFSPIAYGVSGICFLAGMYFHRLFLVMPVARGALIQELNIAVLLLDRRGCIADFNGETMRLFPSPLLIPGGKYKDFPELAQVLESAGYDSGSPSTKPRSGRLSLGTRELSWTMRSISSLSKTTFVTIEDVTEQSRLRTEVTLIKEEFTKREKQATIGRIAAGLAHEINNPLACLKSDARSLDTLVNRKCAEKIKEDPEIGEVLEITRAMGAGLERIERSVGSLLAFARQGSLPIEHESFEFDRVIETTLELIRHETKNRIHLRTNLAILPPIHGSRSELSQVLFNIMLNAIHAIDEAPPPEGGEIAITTGLRENHSSMLFCSISNNGVPIRDEHKDRIFDLFFTTKDEKWGTGLGLNLSRDIVEQRHGGRLYLESGNPVTFTIELPLQDSAIPR
jgi:two-component system NtrC family sensor kinase